MLNPNNIKSQVFINKMAKYEGDVSGSLSNLNLMETDDFGSYQENPSTSGHRAQANNNNPNNFMVNIINTFRCSFFKGVQLPGTH